MNTRTSTQVVLVDFQTCLQRLQNSTKNEYHRIKTDPSYILELLYLSEDRCSFKLAGHDYRRRVAALNGCLEPKESASSLFTYSVHFEGFYYFLAVFVLVFFSLIAILSIINFALLFLVIAASFITGAINVIRKAAQIRRDLPDVLLNQLSNDSASRDRLYEFRSRIIC